MKGHDWGADDTEMARLKARSPAKAQTFAQANQAIRDQQLDAHTYQLRSVT